MIVVEPSATVVANPAGLTIATLTLLELQVTRFVRSWVDGEPVNVPTAINCTVSPGAPVFTGLSLGKIEIDVNTGVSEGGGGVEVEAIPTFTSEVAVRPAGTPVVLAVMIAVPELTAVTTPDELTVATEGSEEDQVTAFVMSCVV
jgi:hypothetical protein